MKRTLAPLGMVLAAVLAVGFGPCSRKGDMPEMVKLAARAPVGAVALSTEVIEQTPGGIEHTGKFPLSEASKLEADEGIRELHAAIEQDGFQVKLPPLSVYRISTPTTPCIQSPVSRTYSFVVNGGQVWDGTEWDQYNTRGRLDRPFTDANGLLQVYEKDGTSVVFAAEMVLGFGTDPGLDPRPHFYVCPNPEVVRAAVRHGGDHSAAARYPYTEETREKPPYDGYNWFNCSLYHASDAIHPLFPRLNRCFSETAVPAKRQVIEGLGQQAPIGDELRRLAEANGYTVGPTELLVTGVVLRPVR